MLFKNVKPSKVSLNAGVTFDDEYNNYSSEKWQLKQHLQQLITLLLLWRQLPKYRNLLIEAKIGLLRKEIQFTYLESEALIEFTQARYSEIYTMASYTAAIQAMIRYKSLPNQPIFMLEEALNDDFFPVSMNIYAVIKTSLSDNLKYLAQYCINRSKRIR